MEEEKRKLGGAGELARIRDETRSAGEGLGAVPLGPRLAGPCWLNGPGSLPRGTCRLLDARAAPRPVPLLLLCPFPAPTLPIPDQLRATGEYRHPPPAPPDIRRGKGESPTFAPSLETRPSESAEQNDVGPLPALASRAETLPRNPYLRLRAGESPHRFIPL